MSGRREPIEVAPVDSFGLALPREWVRLPLDRQGFEPLVGDLRRRLAEQGDWSPTMQRQFELVVREIRDDCLREHVTLVAVFATVVGGDDGAPAELLAATCTLATLTQERLGTNLPLTVNTLAAALRQGTTGDRAVDVEPVCQVTLPAGPAVRMVRTYSSLVDVGSAELRVYAEQHLVPFDAGRRAAVLTCATPNVDLAPALSELFREVAETLQLFAGDEPTEP